MMRPVLFHLGSFEVRAYGVFVALAFVAAWAVLQAELGRRADRSDAAGPLILAPGAGQPGVWPTSRASARDD